MYKQTTRTKNGRKLLRNDIGKLKAILAMTARDVGGQAKDALTDSYENVKTKTTDLQEGVAEYVGERPYKSMAIALFSGLALGLAMRRKRWTKRRH